MSHFEIRPATPDDCALVMHFICRLADYEKLLSEVTGTEDDVRRELFGENAIVRAAIAYEGETPVGFALYFFNFSTFLTRRGLYLEDLYIEPEYRGKGYGKALIEYLAREAVKNGCGRFEWVVLEWNEPAIGFYKRIGAKIMQDWRLCRVTGDALKRLAQTGED
ncbi:MAG: GNAT family N-acetyltransferase [Candidatus Aphodousia sp.]|nr:GNAT family N-acetyltransferase [Sutterella sp.]MDY2899169.1 GNAT family N-acetyltransferase [Candidatus Aphodousia sp.]